MPPEAPGELGKGRQRLQAVPSDHQPPARLMVANVTNCSTLHGADVSLSRAGESVTTDQAVVTRADLHTTNWSIYVIDS